MRYHTAGQLLAGAGIPLSNALGGWDWIEPTLGFELFSVTEEEEYDGVDVSECGMEAYPEFTASG